MSDDNVVPRRNATREALRSSPYNKGLVGVGVMVNHDPYSDETQIHQVGMSKVARRVLQTCGAKILLVDVDAINHIVLSEKSRVLTRAARYVEYRACARHALGPLAVCPLPFGR